MSGLTQFCRSFFKIRSTSKKKRRYQVI